MSLANIQATIDQIKAKVSGAYALVQGIPGDGSHHFASGELKSRDGAKPHVLNFVGHGSSEIKEAMADALASGKSVIASGIEHLALPAL